MNLRGWGGFWAAIWLGLAAPMAELAAQTAQDESVTLRPRPDFDAEGLYVADLLDGVLRQVDPASRAEPRSDASSTLLLFPHLTSGVYYDDNLLRRPGNAQGDFALTNEAALALVSSEAERGFTLSGDLLRENYRRFSGQDYTAYEGKSHVYWAPSEEITLNGDLDRSHQRQPLESSGSSLSQTRATFIDQTHARFSLDDNNQDWSFSLINSLDKYDYDRNPPVILGNEFNRLEWAGGARAIYRLAEGIGLFIAPELNIRRYDRPVGLDGLRHDSHGEKLITGTLIDISSVTFAELGVGWIRQSYVDQAFPGISGPTFSASMVWNPTDQASLSLTGGRSIGEANLADVGGVETSLVSVTFDYEIEDDLLAQLGGGFSQLDYLGVTPAFSRRDNVLQGNLSLRYLINQRLSLTASYAFYDRQSDQPQEGLRFNRFLVNATLQY